MNFLESSQKKQLGAPADLTLLARDKDIIVIGGGDTGCDCIATSLRQVSFIFEVTVIIIHYHIIILESKVYYIV